MPAKILSHLGNFTERSCFVTQGETDGEEANTEMSLVCVIFIAFSLFSPLYGLSDSLYVYTVSPCMWVAVPPQNPVSSLLSLASSPPWSHLLLKPAIQPSSLCSPKPNPKPSPAQAPGPLPPPWELNYVCRDPVRWRIHHSPDRDLYNPCSPEHLMWLPWVRGQMHQHAYKQKLHILPIDNTICEMCRY